MSKKKSFNLILILFLLIPAFGFSYDWQTIGPTGIEVNNFCVWGGGIAFEIICEENGMLVNINGVWEEFGNGGLPVWDVEAVVLGSADLMMIMGDGSYSDGIYFFNFSNYEIWVVEYFFNPRFIEYYQANGYFYVGGEQGLLRSENAINWEQVTDFNGLNCRDLTFYGNNLVVSTDAGIYQSLDAGNSWILANNSIYLSDLVYSSSGILYGIFPGELDSSGLWSSSDHGNNWQVEFYSEQMSSTGFDCDGNLFVGWEQPAIDQVGIAMWTPDIWELTFLNDGLENTNINKICIHPLIDCINIMACTDGGAFLLANYQTGSEENIVTENKLSNYPNPFNSTTTIFFETTNLLEDARIEIYNLKGQKVRTLECSNCFAASKKWKHSITWDGTYETGNAVDSGIYFYRLDKGRSDTIGKMLLLKN